MNYDSDDDSALTSKEKLNNVIGTGGQGMV